MIQPRVVTSNDCDSDGEEPPPAAFVDPTTIDEAVAPPPRSNEPLKLPFYKPKERPKLREEFESSITYEDWVDEDDDAGQRTRAGASGATMKCLDRDSDFPVGRLYFWHAFCRACSRTYHPHVPGKWECVVCKEKVWQQADNPESKQCAVCHRDVAKLGGFRNPLRLNAHVCKRCGRVVCDHCYTPTPIGGLEDWGYTEPQKVCTKCVSDCASLKNPPAEEDPGTLYDETVGGDADMDQCLPFWHPRCRRCNITFSQPPKRWACTSCGVAVWQPIEVPDSKNCWLCEAPAPKERCHHCGRLMCVPCGQFARPVPERGFTTGAALSVCRVCYGGRLTAQKELPDKMDVSRGSSGPTIIPAIETYSGKCPDCGQAPGGPPEKWTSKCHNKRCWQTVPAEGGACRVCSTTITSATAENCHRCGWAVCPVCAQYKEPVVERGYPKTSAVPVCRLCYDFRAPYRASPGDGDNWPPSCAKCGKSYARPPDRWRCANQCGLVWQALDHVASRSCANCGKKVAQGHVNCRKCGRIVCAACGEGRAEVPERGFARGVDYPVCKKCLPPPPPAAAAAAAPPAAAAGAKRPPAK